MAATLLTGILASGCASIQSEKYLAQANGLAINGGLKAIPVNTHLPVMVWGRLAAGDAPVHVYIEGDGHAWRNSRQPSTDPTPHDPVALQVAAKDSAPDVLYLGRPCQYDPDPSRGCNFRVWTDERFSGAEVLNSALDQLVGKNRRIVLVGFSGGANLAVQLAASRQDVDGLITLAGNLDSRAFTQYHSLPTETYGQNAPLISALKDLPQVHYTGGKDPVIPPDLTRRQLGAAAHSGCIDIVVRPDARHQGPWSIDWVGFDHLVVSCKGGSSLY